MQIPNIFNLKFVVLTTKLTFLKYLFVELVIDVCTN